MTSLCKEVVHAHLSKLGVILHARRIHQLRHLIIMQPCSVPGLLVGSAISGTTLLPNTVAWPGLEAWVVGCVTLPSNFAPQNRVARPTPGENWVSYWTTSHLSMAKHEGHGCRMANMSDHMAIPWGCIQLRNGPDQTLEQARRDS